MRKFKRLIRVDQLNPLRGFKRLIRVDRLTPQQKAIYDTRNEASPRPKFKRLIRVDKLTPQQKAMYDARNEHHRPGCKTINVKGYTVQPHNRIVCPKKKR